MPICYVFITIGYENARIRTSSKFKYCHQVENTPKNMVESVITVAELKYKLPRQVNHNTLKIILEYLELSNKIVITMRGIT